MELSPQSPLTPQRIFSQHCEVLMSEMTSQNLPNCDDKMSISMNSPILVSSDQSETPDRMSVSVTPPPNSGRPSPTDFNENMCLQSTPVHTREIQTPVPQFRTAHSWRTQAKMAAAGLQGCTYDPNSNSNSNSAINMLGVASYPMVSPLPQGILEEPIEPNIEIKNLSKRLKNDLNESSLDNINNISNSNCNNNTYDENKEMLEIKYQNTIKADNNFSTDLTDIDNEEAIDDHISLEKVKMNLENNFTEDNIIVNVDVDDDNEEINSIQMNAVDDEVGELEDLDITRRELGGGNLAWIVEGGGGSIGATGTVFHLRLVGSVDVSEDKGGEGGDGSGGGMPNKMKRPRKDMVMEAVAKLKVGFVCNTYCLLLKTEIYNFRYILFINYKFLYAILYIYSLFYHYYLFLF